MLSKPFSVILALSKNHGIGLNGINPLITSFIFSIIKKGQLPWNLRKDLQNLKKITTNPKIFNPSSKNKQNVVIMGRKTYESLPKKVRPMPERINIVLSHDNSASFEPAKGLHICNSLENSLHLIEQQLKDQVEEVYILGGARVFEEAMAHRLCQQVLLTRIGLNVKCDTFVSKEALSPFKHIETSKTYIESDIPFTFSRYYNPKVSTLNPQILSARLYEKHEEFQYLDLVNQVIRSQSERNDRTNTGTLSMFGGMMRFNLENGFPLLTTKDVFWRGVVEELLWFMRGETNGRLLAEKNIKIWEGNGSREFLDALGLKDRVEGDLGPIYGFQWRHFGAEYVDMYQNYENKGVDQLRNVIELIKKQPESRRIVMSAWNPKDLPKMALPPCHVMSQFYVQDGKLSCMMFQRSADMGLGVPFNIASYSLLTCILAEVYFKEKKRGGGVKVVIIY